MAIISWLDLEHFPGLKRWENTFAWTNALLIAVLIGAWTYVQFHAAPGYTTDELSFDQYAAQLVAHGLHNPYTASMRTAGPLYRLSPDAYTYTISGLPVMQPVLSVAVVPGVCAVHPARVDERGRRRSEHDGVGGRCSADFRAASTRSARRCARVLEHRRLPGVRSRGVTDMLYIPLLIIAAYRWDRFGPADVPT